MSLHNYSNYASQYFSLYYVFGQYLSLFFLLTAVRIDRRIEAFVVSDEIVYIAVLISN